MVRFSDIKEIRDKTATKERSKGREAEADELRLSDTQTGEVNGERITFDAGGEEGASLELVNCYEKFIGKAIEIRNRVISDQGISPSPILSDLHHIIDSDLVDKLYEYAMSSTQEYDEIIVHNVNVTLASLKVGEGVDYDTRRLLELGLAAFLQNVGMYKIPEHILKKAGRLSESEMEVIRDHSETGSQILSRMGARYQWLAEVASQVHERADGSGYPQGLKGPEISELASIIGLMDTYLAMITERPYRVKYLRPDAVKFIIKEGKGLFPPRILKVFLNQISLFPVNTYVRLNNKSIGRVISTDKNQPLRPAIQLFYDGLGNKIEEKEIVRLSDNPLLYIVESIDETELA